MIQCVSLLQAAVISWLLKNRLFSSLPECTKTFFSPTGQQQATPKGWQSNSRSNILQEKNILSRLKRPGFDLDQRLSKWRAGSLNSLRGGSVEGGEEHQHNITEVIKGRALRLSKMSNVVREILWVWGSSTDFLTYPELETKKCPRTDLSFLYFGLVSVSIRLCCLNLWVSVGSNNIIIIPGTSSNWAKLSISKWRGMRENAENAQLKGNCELFITSQAID